MTDWLDWLDRQALRESWSLDPRVTYLNHGSFGPPPNPVRKAREDWQAALDANPMDFFFRRYDAAWHAARRRLADLVGGSDQRLVLVENATHAMNVLADSMPLQAGDEIVLTDHEYGAVRRIWERAADRSGAAPPRIACLPQPLRDADQVVDAIRAAFTSRTRLLIVSHITSPTAITLPVEAILAAAHGDGVPVCIDGPHAVAQLDLQLDNLGCDYYCASCHKWLSAPFGSGFLYIGDDSSAAIAPQRLSWGRLPPHDVEAWSHEFIWSGTRDPAAWLSIPAAIDFLDQVGWEAFRQATHALAQYARTRLVQRFGLPPLIPDSPAWYGSMAQVPLPPGDHDGLQQRLWDEFRIEVPIVAWGERRWIRVSCHLYNTREDVDRLVDALGAIL